MRVGVDLPYFADAGAIRAYARGVEEMGFHHLSFSEHVAGTRDTAYPPGFSFDDPWHESFTLLGFLAGVTSRVELNPAMVLLPLRPAVLAAKQAAEVDLLTGGRLRLAVSVGWNGRETAALGVIAPRARGAFIEEQIEVMRLLWTAEAVTYAGGHVRLDEVGICPRPARSIPVWMGGGRVTDGGYPPEKVLSRIARVADGYKMIAPLSLDVERGVEIMARLREMVVEAGRDSGTFGMEARIVAHRTEEEEWPRLVARWKEAGATHLGLANRVAGGGVEEQLARVRRFVELTRDAW